MTKCSVHPSDKQVPGDELVVTSGEVGWSGMPWLAFEEYLHGTGLKVILNFISSDLRRRSLGENREGDQTKHISGPRAAFHYTSKNSPLQGIQPELVYRPWATSNRNRSGLPLCRDFAENLRAVLASH